jgi:putative transposase
MPSTYNSLTIHAVFATKHRAPMIDPAWVRDLHAYQVGILRNLGATPLAVGGVADHVHLLFGIRPSHSLADVIREVKRASSVWAAERYAPFKWQAGYGAFSVCYDRIPPLRAYIANQEEHHRQLSSEDELRALLAEHGVPVDERFFE